MIQVEGIFAGVGGNELIVTAPTGSTVTVTKGSVTKTVAEKDGTWTFKGLEDGDWTVTATYGNDSKSVSVTIGVVEIVIAFKPTASLTAQSGVSYTNGLNGLGADVISLFSAAISNNGAITNTTSTVYIDFGSVHRKVSVGDRVTLSLNGANYAFDVIGFNHDTLTDTVAYGEETATGKAGITFQMHDLFATTYEMNSTQTNKGGWKSSDMRTSTMATMKGYLPSDWQYIIKPVNKVSGKGGTTASWSGTTTVSDSCFLLAEIEIFGSTTHSVSGEGSQYAYYKAGNSKIKNRSGSASSWWERSPKSANTGGFGNVDSNGDASARIATRNGGVAFGFCV